MRAGTRAWAAAALVAGLTTGAFGCAPGGPDLAGRWDATVVVNGVDIPCAFEIAGRGAAMTGAFFNSSLQIVSTGTTIEGDKVRFAFDQYGSALDLTATGDSLEGEWERARGPYPFHAVRAQARAALAEPAPSIDGVWIVKARGSKSEAAWRFIVKQHDADVEAAILRVDGDTGALTGGFDGSRFVLGHFDGSRPMRMEVTANADGTLTLVENGRTESTAVREGSAAATAIGTPEDPTYHTTVRDLSEPFAFSFPDLNGQIVSNTDARFQGKVVLVSISGSWCPNCHDEAPFHAALYRKYRDRGFEVVSLSFERADQLADPVQLRAFIKTYGIEYTVLMPGEPDQATELLPQTVNLDCFPTSFILGRDGRVRAVHAGFPSPGSGSYYDEAVRETTDTIEALLAEPAGAAPAVGASTQGPSRRPALALTPGAPAPVHAGGAARLSLTVAVPDGYHVQAHEPRDPALVPTVLDVRAPAGLTVDRVIYPDPKPFTLAGTNEPLLVYGPSFTVEAVVRVAAGTAPATLTIPATLAFQACDDRVCFAPTHASASWKLTVE